MTPTAKQKCTREKKNLQRSTFPPYFLTHRAQNNSKSIYRNENIFFHLTLFEKMRRMTLKLGPYLGNLALVDAAMRWPSIWNSRLFRCGILNITKTLSLSPANMTKYLQYLLHFWKENYTESTDKYTMSKINSSLIFRSRWDNFTRNFRKLDLEIFLARDFVVRWRFDKDKMLEIVGLRKDFFVSTNNSTRVLNHAYSSHPCWRNIPRVINLQFKTLCSKVVTAKHWRK